MTQRESTLLSLFAAIAVILMVFVLTALGEIPLADAPILAVLCAVGMFVTCRVWMWFAR